MRLVTVVVFAACAFAADPAKPLLEIPLGMPLGQMRAAPVSLGSERGLLLVYGQDAAVDPYHEMFFYPKGTLNLAVISQKGRVLWKKDLGRGIVPGMWFCPVFPFDTDGDGVDEIWFVNNVDADHPLSVNGMRLERLDGRTGRTLGQSQWPKPPVQSMSHTYRNFILGGMANGRPVLITAQGTYGEMALQGWNPDLSKRWEHRIPNGPGPRGSHMTAVTDMNGDGVDEVLWGERVIEIDKGQMQACGDCSKYNGHSDVAQPFVDRETGKWYLYTCRESDPKASPRVVTFDRSGERVWGDLDQGHIDMGWIAHFPPDGRAVAMAIRIGSKKAGPDGTERGGVEEFLYDAVTGERMRAKYPVFGALPVDWNGDGMHELVREEGEVIDAATGVSIAKLNGAVAVASKLLDLPGEQVLTYSKDGRVRIYGDPSAKDSEIAKKRYAHPMYRLNQKLGAVGYNRNNVAGL